VNKKPHVEAGGTVDANGRFQFLECSFVADPPDPRARIFKRCEACKAQFPGSHPENGCEMSDVFDTHES
jgi:hypothetical protein